MLVREGVLILESAVDKSIKLNLKGKSTFMINDVDISQFLLHSGLNGSTTDQSDASVLGYLMRQMHRANSILRGSNGILRRLEALENE